MGDALTDIAKDERRSRLFWGFLQATTDYLESPDPEKLEAVIETARATDRVRGGYWGGSTSLSQDLEENLARLLEGDQGQWAKLLMLFDGSEIDSEPYKRLKACSPFADKLLLLVDYGYGFVTFKGELERWVARRIREEKNWVTYDCDKYLMILEEPQLQDVEVLWVDCGIHPNPGGPRSPRED